MDTNVAAPQGEAAPSTNVETQAPVAPASTPEAPAITAEQVASFLGTTPDGLANYQKFVDNNGGFDKAFSTYKSRITERPPEPAPQPQMAAPQQPMPQPNPMEQAPQPKVEGGFTAQEFMVQQYFQNLGTQERYASIKDEIYNGEVLKVMNQFGIKPIIGDQFNNKQVTDFLDLYAKTKPAPAPEAPITPTPTADFVQIADGKITSMEQAMLVLSQDREARAAGREGHPLAAQANEFFDNALNAQQRRGHREHKELASK